MKIKKIISTALLTCTFLVGNLSQAQPVSAALDKDQAIQIVKKGNPDIKSAQLSLSGSLKIKKEKPVKFNTSGQIRIDPVVSYQAININYGKKKVKTTLWISADTNRVYYRNKGKWVAEKIPAPTKKPKGVSQQLLTSLTNQPNINQINDFVSQSINEKSNLTEQNGTYTLTVDVDTPEFKKLFVQLLASSGLGKKDVKSYQKNVNFTKIQYLYTIKDDKLVGYTGLIKLNLTKKVNFTYQLTMDHFDEYNNLSLPAKVKSAKLAKLK